MERERLKEHVCPALLMPTEYQSRISEPAKSKEEQI